MARKPFIGANIKMNPLPSDLSAYAPTPEVDIVIFPTAPDLRTCIEKKLSVGAQYARPEEKGAFTGDLSIAMLKDTGITHVLCGHSERRINHGESDALVAEQVKAALAQDLTAILCIGETEEERDAGKTKEVLKRQLTAVTDHCLLTTDRSIIAYEPVWAIGSGKTPTAEEIQETHAFLRSLLPDPETRIIYGGSVKAENAKEIFGCEDVDGGLIGGASLDPETFRTIVRSV